MVGILEFVMPKQILQHKHGASHHLISSENFYHGHFEIDLQTGRTDYHSRKDRCEFLK